MYPIPHSDESAIPFSILNYVLNPFEMGWFWPSLGLYFSLALTIPRIWYWSSFKYYPQRIFLLRGGRVLRVETQSLGNDRYTFWLENHFIKPLT